jgi:hypothetical protein
MKKEIIAKVSRIKKAYASVVVNMATYGESCTKCGTETPFDKPAHRFLTCSPEELEQTLYRLQNINILGFETGVAANTLVVSVDVMRETLCDACKPKKVDLSSVVHVAKNGTREYPTMIVMAPILDKKVRCQIKDMKRSEGLYSGKLSFYKKVNGETVLTVLTFQWNPKNHPIPMVTENSKIIQDEGRRKMLQDLVKAAFNVYGEKLREMAEATPAQKPYDGEVVETEHTHRCNDIDESQYFAN